MALECVRTRSYLLRVQAANVLKCAKRVFPPLPLSGTFVVLYIENDRFFDLTTEQQTSTDSHLLLLYIIAQSDKIWVVLQLLAYGIFMNVCLRRKRIFNN